MQVDFELYRLDVTVQQSPQVRLSVIDIEPPESLNTIVLVHGFGGYALQWKYQLSEFSDTNRVIAYDLRGHGRSDKPSTEYSVQEMVDDLLGLLDSLAITEPVVLVGHSFGGAIVSSFATTHPDRVKSVILTATAVRFQLPFYTRAIFAIPSALLNLIGPIIREYISAPPFVLKRFFHNALNSYEGEPILRSIEAPSLVIRGDRDLVFPQSTYEEVARLIPHAEDVNLGVSKHMVILERRDAVNRAIRRFLGQGGDTWRSDPDDVKKALDLMTERPWVNEYEDGVPPTLSIPERPLTILLDSATRRFPNRPATIFAGRTLTYRQMDRQVNRLANALRGMGVDAGMRVMILMPNLPQWVIAFYGVLRAGGVVVGANPLAEADEIIREIDDAQVDFLITLPKYSATARQALDQTDLRHVIYTSVKDYMRWQDRTLYSLTREASEGQQFPSPLRPEERRWIDLMRKYHANPLNVQIDAHSLAVIQYTGGTTDRPKGVMLSHSALIANAFQVRHWVPTMREGRERLLAAVPFGHSYGLTLVMNFGLSLAATLIIVPQFVPLEVLKIIKRYKPTLLPGVPTMYVAINNYPGVRRFGLESITACISGAAPLPVEVKETFEKLTRGKLVEGYGLTEAGPATHANPIFGRGKTGMIGVPLPNTEARIIHLKTGKALPPGEIGELIVRGPQIMDGYWNQPELTARALRDGWLYTGDVARMDAEGYFQIVSRKKEMWYPERDNGDLQPAFPRDVEEVIYELPEVSEAAVVGLGNRAIAFVTTTRSIDPATIKAYCERRLPPELVPVVVFIVDEMPKTFVGKIVRWALLDHIPEHQRGELDIVSDRIDAMLDYPFESSS